MAVFKIIAPVYLNNKDERIIVRGVGYTPELDESIDSVSYTASKAVADSFLANLGYKQTEDFFEFEEDFSNGATPTIKWEGSDINIAGVNFPISKVTND